MNIIALLSIGLLVLIIYLSINAIVLNIKIARQCGQNIRGKNIIYKLVSKLFLKNLPL